MAKSKVNILHSNSQTPNSCDFFKPHWLCWKILGIVAAAADTTKSHHRYLYVCYSIILNVLVTICYPLHLALLLFQSDNQADNIKNLAVTVTCVACSVKFIIYSTKMPSIQQFERILQKLDARINVGKELQYFRQLKHNLHNIALLFLSAYLSVGLTAVLSSVFRDERSLLYPAWMPLNWRYSTWQFVAANIYQIVGIFFLILQNFVDDCFPAMSLCMLSGHIELLSMRVANIGYDQRSRKYNEEELNRCIDDQQNLNDLLHNIESIISLPMFIQFCVTATNICVAMAALLFYVSAPLDILYYFVYFSSMPLQIFPTCYYGSDFQYLFDQLHRAVFASNWTNQSNRYKKHMMLFVERSLKQNVAMAGGMVRIHLDTFFQTCRGAYSLFAIIVRMK